MINPKSFIKEIERYFCLTEGSLVDRDRHITTANARAIAMYLLRYIFNYSYWEIANYFNRDHSTVISNCKKIANNLRVSKYSTISIATMDLLSKYRRIQNV